MSADKQRKIRGTMRRRGSKMQPTKEKLLHTALLLLETHFPEDITGDMVLAHSSVSRGSLYHHFADVSDLVEQALVRRFSARVDENIATLDVMVENCSSPEYLYDQLCVMTDTTQSSGNSRHRFLRARLIGFAEGNERLTQRLGAEQQRLTEALTNLFAQAQNRGWLNRDFSPKAAALFVQAYTLGRVIDDISLEPVDQDEWNAFINRVIKLVLC